MKKIELDQFCQISYAGSLSSSPEEDKLCFVRSVANLDTNQYESNLWLYEKEAGFKQLTYGNSDKGPIWLDNRTLAFFSNRNQASKDDQTRVYTISVHGGEASLFLETCHEISSFKVVDSTHWLVHFTYHPDRFELQQAQNSEGLKEYKSAVEGWKEFEEIPFWSNGEGHTSKQRNALGLLDLETKKIEILTDQLTDVYHYDLHPEKHEVVYIYNCFKNVMSIYNSIGLIDLKTKEKREISHNDAFMHERCQYDPKGQIIMLGTDGKICGLNENAYFYKIDPINDRVELLSKDFDASTGSSIGSDVAYGAGGDSDWLFTDQGMIFSSTQGHSCNLFLLNHEGFISEVTQIDGSIYNFVKMGDAIVFNGLLDHRPMEIFSYTINGIQKLSDFNLGYGDSLFLSIPEPLNYINEDGIQIDGWVVKPKDFNPKRRYPTLLDIHGGPKTAYGSVYFHEMQYWASEGFVVIFCNPRGSDGKGNVFSDIRGKYGTIDYTDIMGFVDHALEKCPWINHEQLGVTGGSYGGFMTNWIIGHTQRFNAAATQRSISNWVTEYGVTDIGYYFVKDQIGVTPWENIEKLWNDSPLKYADQIKTPTLILHSEEDYRCWLPEGLQLFTALKVNQVPSKMVMFHGENHELSRSGKPKNRIKRLKEITEWMKNHLQTKLDE